MGEKPTSDLQRLPAYGRLWDSPPHPTMKHVSKKCLRQLLRPVKPRRVLRVERELRSVRIGWTNTDTLVLSVQEESSMLISFPLIRNQWEDSTWERVDKFGQFLT